MRDALLDDARKIKCIINGEWWRTVGIQGVADIRVARVAGEGAYVPWFEVWYEGDVAARELVRASWIAVVEYAPATGTATGEHE